MISFNSLTGTINIIEKVKPQLDEASFNSLNGTINTIMTPISVIELMPFQFLNWCD